MLEVLAPSPYVLGAALAADLLFGEPRSAVHPVVWMGTGISALLRFAPERGRFAPLGYGVFVALFLPTLCVGVTAGAFMLLAGWPLVATLASVFVLKSTFAVRALGEAALRVQGALTAGSVEEARAHLTSLCSRDASALTPADLAGATVESVAENASDSFVAPLVYYALFGLPGAVAYRAINTLDARIGYRGRYEYLGKAAARLDDLANLVPARATAVLLLAAGWLRRLDVARGVRVLVRDGRKTASPNAGLPMAAAAGLLGVALTKAGHYRLGDAAEPLTPATIDAAWNLVVVAAVVASAIALVALAIRTGVPV